jgi:hypothetical protein
MSRPPAGRLAAALATAAMAAATFVMAVPTAQAVPGLIRVTASTPTDATSPKLVTASCPRGTATLDGGATIHGGGGNAEVRITGLVPQPSGFRASASAGTAGYPGAWSLTAYAICSPPPPGYGISSGHDTAASTQWWRTFNGGCPIGKRLIGFGAEALDTSGDPATGVALQILKPNANLQRFLGQAYRVDDDYRHPWQLWGYSVCADPLPGQVRVVEHPDTSGGSVATATCPEGTRVHGVGGLINAAPGEVGLVGMYPTTDLTRVLTFGEEVTGSSGHTWHPLSYAICAE